MLRIFRGASLRGCGFNKVAKHLYNKCLINTSGGLPLNKDNILYIFILSFLINYTFEDSFVILMSLYELLCCCCVVAVLLLCCCCVDFVWCFVGFLLHRESFCKESEIFLMNKCVFNTIFASNALNGFKIYIPLLEEDSSRNVEWCLFLVEYHRYTCLIFDVRKVSPTFLWRYEEVSSAD